MPIETNPDAQSIAQSLDSGKADLVNEALSSMREAYRSDFLAYRRLVSDINRNETNRLGSDLTIVDGTPAKAQVTVDGTAKEVLSADDRENAMINSLAQGVRTFKLNAMNHDAATMRQKDKLEMSQWLTENYDRLTGSLLFDSEITMNSFTKIYKDMKFNDGKATSDLDLLMLEKVSRYFRTIGNASRRTTLFNTPATRDWTIRMDDVEELASLAKQPDDFARVDSESLFYGGEP